MRPMRAMIACVICSAPLLLQGAGPATRGADSGGMVVKTYDVGALLRVEQDYPLLASMIPIAGSQESGGGGGGGGGGGRGGGESLFGVQSPMGIPGFVPGGNDPVTLQALTQMIVQTVDAESWQQQQAGARIGSIGNVLVISQTPKNHETIGELLASLSKEIGPSYVVSVRAYWLMLDPQDLATLTKIGSDKTGALSEVPAELLDPKKVYSTGQTLGFSGQTVHITARRGQRVATGVDPVVGTNAVGYQVRTEVMQSGVAIQLTPKVIDDGAAAIVDLHSFVSEVGASDSMNVSKVSVGMDSRTGPSTRPEEELKNLMQIDRTGLVTQQFSSTVRIPTGKKILIGGMTMEPSRSDPSRQLYLVIEANASK